MLAENKRLAELYCTGCNYCMPCPQNIQIPRLFGIMNNHRVYNLTNHAKHQYKEVMRDEKKGRGEDASKCVECGACEAKCPQKLPIIQQLKEVHKALA
jgi:predicted aldo/keto reductase-like oxidoreductase